MNLEPRGMKSLGFHALKEDLFIPLFSWLSRLL